MFPLTIGLACLGINFKSLLLVMLLRARPCTPTIAKVPPNNKFPPLLIPVAPDKITQSVLMNPKSKNNLVLVIFSSL